MNFKYFNLMNECYLVPGIKKSILHNLLFKKLIWLDKEQTELIIKAEAGDVVDENDLFLNELCKVGWGFFSEHKYYIDKLRTKNLFSETGYYKERPLVLIASIQLLNECNLNCTNCADIFCPTCVNSKDNISLLEVSTVKNIIDELIKFGLRLLVLTGGEISLYENLSDVISYAEDKGLGVSLCTNGIQKIEGLNENTSLLLSVFSEGQLCEIIKNYNEYNNVSIINYTKKNIDASFLNPNWSMLKQNATQPDIQLTHIQQVGLEEFYVRKYGNACLQNRIYITSDMNVIPCFGNKKVISNLNEEQFPDILLKIYKDVWHNSRVSSEEYIKCNNCEFRYSCVYCGKVKEESGCNYKLEAAEWI